MVKETEEEVYAKLNSESAHHSDYNVYDNICVVPTKSYGLTTESVNSTASCPTFNSHKVTENTVTPDGKTIPFSIHYDTVKLTVPKTNESVLTEVS